MSAGYLWAAILVMAGVTALIRFAPFLLFPRGRATPAFVMYLGRVLPRAVIGMLVVYCLGALPFGTAADAAAQIIAGSLTAVSYVLKRKTWLSLVVGVGCYMFLLRLMVY